MGRVRGWPHGLHLPAAAGACAPPRQAAMYSQLIAGAERPLVHTYYDARYPLFHTVACETLPSGGGSILSLLGPFQWAPTRSLFPSRTDETPPEALCALVFP